jgi:hypothetical protein
MRLRTALLLGAAALAAGARCRHRNWGATPDECARRLPGDELIPEPATTTTRATSIDAPPALVWPWLVQIGQGRGGWYSYDWIENLLGLDIHSTFEIRDEWQRLAVGDRVAVVPAGWGPLPEGYAFRVEMVEPGRTIVLRQAPPEHPWNAVWTFVLEPDGPDGSRLLARSRAEVQPGLSGLLARLAGELIDPVTLVMTRKMLLGIKHRAEHHGPRAARPSRATAEGRAATG